MAQLKTYTCDVCGTEKKAANHWYTLDTTGKTAVVTKWDPELAEHVEYHLCGSGCLQRKLVQVINAWSTGMPSPARKEAMCATK